MLETQNGRFGERANLKTTPNRQQSRHEHAIGIGDLLVVASPCQDFLKALELLLEGNRRKGNVSNGMRIDLLKDPRVSPFQKRENVGVQEEHAYWLASSSSRRFSAMASRKLAKNQPSSGSASSWNGA